MTRTLWRVVSAVALLAAVAAPSYADGAPVDFNVLFDTGTWDPGTSSWTGSVFDSTTHPTWVGGAYDVTITGGSWTDPSIMGFWEFNGSASFSVEGGGDSLVGTSDIAITVWAAGDQVDPSGWHTVELTNGTVTGGTIGGIGNTSGLGSYYSTLMSVEALGVDGAGNPTLGSLSFAGDGAVDGDYVPTPELPPGMLALVSGPGLLWWRMRRRGTKA